MKVWGCFSIDTTILHTFLSAPACTTCTGMVYSKELECDVQLVRWRRRYCALKLWHLFLHRTDRFDLFTYEGRIKAVMYMPCVNALGKTSAYFLCFDIKLMKSRSGFDLVTVLISKQSFFQHRAWPV